MFYSPILAIDPIYYSSYLDRKELLSSLDLKQIDKDSIPPFQNVLQKSGSRALINVHGMMQLNPNIFERLLFGSTDTMDIIKATQEVRADNKIKSVVFNFDTPGGDVRKLNVLSNSIAQLSDEKQTASVNTGLMASAGFRAGSQTNFIFSDDEFNRTGSIGTFVTLMDFSEKFKQEGIKPVHIATGSLKGQPVMGLPITEEFKDHIMEMVEMTQEQFNVEIERKRPSVDLSEGSEVLTGKSFHSAKAMELNLIDGIKSIEETFRFLEANDTLKSIRSSI